MTGNAFLRCLIALLIAALALLWVSRYTNLDLQLADWMYDFPTHRFPWKETWFAAVFMHEWLKDVLICLGLAVIASLAADRMFALNWFNRATRHKLHVVAASYVLVPLIISILKSQSMHACPWDLERYGGSAPYLRLFDTFPDDAVIGHCFPAGHASSALWLAALFIFWLPERPKTAALVFFAGSLPGLALGWVQQMRGAHFLTHTLWSMWIASLVILILARLIHSRRDLSNA